MLLKRGSSHLTEARLIGARWVFGFKDSGIITDSFYFGANRSIENYQGEFEKSWRLEDGTLKICDAAGNVTLSFHVTVLLDGKLLLVSAHSIDPTGAMHVYLLEQGPRVLPSGEVAELTKRKPKSSTGEFKAAVITMVYNEGFFLPLWYRYYGAQVGHENLYVIDHGSTDGSVDPTLCNQIKIPRDKFDDKTRTEMVSALHRSLLNYFDVVIYTDCDEFIVVRPDKFESLLDYLQWRRHDTVRCVGVNILPHEQDMPPLDMTAPILLQRPFGFATHWYFKPLISSVPTIWNPGFHGCDMPAVLDLDVWLFHLKFADFQYGLERQDTLREIEWSKGKGTHLPSADQMTNFLAKLQADCRDERFEDVDLVKVFTAKQNSNLCRIPVAFLTVF
jgi:hypothetical protein